MTSTTTTPAPCICPDMPDKFTLNIKTNLFWKYARSNAPAELFIYKYFFIIRQIFPNNAPNPAWTLNGKPVRLDNDKNPLINPADDLDHNFWEAPISLDFRKADGITEEGCNVYVTTHKNLLPSGLVIVYDAPQPIGQIGQGPIIMAFSAKLFVLDGKWTIAWFMEGTGNKNFKPPRMVTDNICPMDGGFEDGAVLVLPKDESWDAISSKYNEPPYTVASLLLPFKNSVLGF